MIDIERLPTLSYDVSLIASSQLTETVGPACLALGAVVGVFINQMIH